jgi:6-phosphogluconolactonase/glucosamine-6-phosphate isomerase/deaminase
MMNHIKIDGVAEAAAAISKRLTELAHKKPVMFLVPGGSGAPVAAGALNSLPPDISLKLSLTDERFGRPGHLDSNWKLLSELGLDLARWDCYEVLQGKPAAQTTVDFSDYLAKALADKLYVIGLFGLGEDGHTAGILPGSPAVDSKQLAAHYKAADFERLTVTTKFIKQIDEAFLYAVGKNKQQQLSRLRHKIELKEMPAQVLTLTNLTVLSDYKGE